MSGADLDTFARRIGDAGLTVRGAFQVADGDGVPPPVRAGDGQTLVLIGNAGSGFWPVFERSNEYRDGRPDPLDRWSERVIGELARQLGARAVFPFGGPPYHPFQRWARRAEPVTPSPMGLLIHPEYGLWHAYRGALIVDRLLAIPRPEGTDVSPCLSCEAQPCLNTCPVDAFRADGFRVDDCVAHLSGPNDCIEEGCRARNACPAGKPFRYMREQHRFHLAAFLRARALDT